MVGAAGNFQCGKWSWPFSFTMKACVTVGGLVSVTVGHSWCGNLFWEELPGLQVNSRLGMELQLLFRFKIRFTGTKSLAVTADHMFKLIFSAELFQNNPLFRFLRVVHFAHFQVQTMKWDVLGLPWGCFVYLHIGCHIQERVCDGWVKNRGCWWYSRQNETHLGKMRPIWTIYMKNGQKWLVIDSRIQLCQCACDIIRATGSRGLEE